MATSMGGETARREDYVQFSDVKDWNPHAQPRRGRPSGAGFFESREEFCQKVLQAMDKLRKLDRPVTQETVIEMLGIAGDARRIREWCARFGVTWEELRNHP